ncbi:indolepyruvate ferredoxin oxidoreductase family protein [Roseibium sp.]|uniref:indolepyruvate ferredoxin oxidoreductase family protein n=1 Tax=Roseibium sp. TaxID=1936156 RepID=UPI003A97844E
MTIQKPKVFQHGEPMFGVSLEDKYTAGQGQVYLTGIQALVRLALERARLDRKAGLTTGGFISGYRGSPLGGYDSELERAAKLLDPMRISVLPAVNEELGATAVWGSQKTRLHGKGSDLDGVFGFWYGKAPGVDRAGDALKQANAAGTDVNGGVLALAGDDHLAKSSILTGQSEFYFQHAEIPIFNPSDIQDVLDYGQHGLALSRYAGLWSALICVADTMDASAIVNADENRLSFRLPAGSDPRDVGELNRDLMLANRLETERLLREVRLPAVRAYVKENGLDRVAFGARGAVRLGLVATGKAYRDLRQALKLIGIDETRAQALGIAIYKVAVSWPLEPDGLRSFVRGAERLLVVEHKRAFMEPQIKEICYHLSDGARPEIWGKVRPEGSPFLSDVLELSVAELVQGLIDWLPGDVVTPDMQQVVERMNRQEMWAQGNAERAARIPYFCSGCPHSTSTRVPEGARALPGIGCHTMTELAGRTRESQIQMGGEGILWVGQHTFSKDTHVFANLGDGTYFHSGILAIRQAVAAKAPMTYKLLYNDAVAMTGGQAVDGSLSVPQITRQLEAEGVARVAVVSEHPEQYGGWSNLAPGTEVFHRDELMRLQEDLQQGSGVSVIVYDQTCATEKRRRRKRGKMAAAQSRLFINERVCEGCGDCSVQSNCLSVEPLATPFGEKRVINQSSCNMDMSCLKGFCPSFVELEGASPRRATRSCVDIDALVATLPEPARPTLTRSWNMLIAGVGGMGVTTVSAVLAMAAHLDAVQAATLDMTGLAQKGGPVTSHLRFNAGDAEIDGPRVPPASLDVLMAADMVVATNAEQLALLNRGETLIVANSHVAPTAEFVLRQTQSYDEARMIAVLTEGAGTFLPVDAAKVAEALLGDAIFVNMLLVGMVYQAGGLPLSAEAIEEAARLNGTAVSANIRAFRAGRVLAVNREAIISALPGQKPVVPETLEQEIARFEGELVAYQGRAYAEAYRSLMDDLQKSDAAQPAGGQRLSRVVARQLYRVMAYKDEYEVARLYADPAFRKTLEERFDDPSRIRIHLAPPLLSRRTDKRTGRPAKMAFGPWVFGVFKVMAGLRGLRGTFADPFGYTAERRAERALIRQYRSDLELILARLGKADYGLLVELARVPDLIRGYGAVKEAGFAKAATRREALLKRIDCNDDGSGQRTSRQNGSRSFLEAAE